MSMYVIDDTLNQKIRSISVIHISYKLYVHIYSEENWTPAVEDGDLDCSYVPVPTCDSINKCSLSSNGQCTLAPGLTTEVPERKYWEDAVTYGGLECEWVTLIRKREIFKLSKENSF